MHASVYRAKVIAAGMGNKEAPPLEVSVELRIALRGLAVEPQKSELGLELDSLD
jgi:hypothetical protein